MLKIVVTQETVPVPVAVMSLEGELDAATYLDAIAVARQLVEGGATYILLDLEQLTYMGSSGLFVVHSVAMLLRGEEPPDPEDGWGAIHQVEPTPLVRDAPQAARAPAPGRSRARAQRHEALLRDVHGSRRGARLVLT